MEEPVSSDIRSDISVWPWVGLSFLCLDSLLTKWIVCCCCYNICSNQGLFPTMSYLKFRRAGLEPLNMISNTHEDIFPHIESPTLTTVTENNWRRMKINSLMRVLSLTLGVSKLTFWGHFICFCITLIRMLPPSSLQLRMLWPLQKASWLTFAQIFSGKVTARVQQHVPLITTHDRPLSHWMSNGLAVQTNDVQVSVVRQGHLMEYWNTGRSLASLLSPGISLAHRQSMPGIRQNWHPNFMSSLAILLCHCFSFTKKLYPWEIVLIDHTILGTEGKSFWISKHTFLLYPVSILFY